ncbi:MAG: ATP-grasp domain-containing protein [Caldilineaceae bacterium]|nr:ATP-grasp domain-containing protein [Caldilineaceae bacterium]
MSNVLILSAGRRVELIRAFQQELRRELPSFKVLAADMNPGLSAACHIVDRAIPLPKATDTIYIESLYEQCIAHDVRLVIPTIDTELLPLAQCREKFGLEGITIVVSDESTVIMCQDKRKTAGLFHSIGIETPAIYQKDEILFPCFAKPYDGSSSNGAMIIWDSSMLSKSLLEDPKIMFMEFIDRSWTEFTVDVYYNKDGILKCLVPRERIEVRSGEVSKGITRRNKLYDYLSDKLTLLEGVRGCVTLQIFASKTCDSYAAIEINPRFGGGYPLSYAAGANYPKWLIQEYLLDEEIPFFDKWKSNLLMLRYDAKVVVEDAADLL